MTDKELKAYSVFAFNKESGAVILPHDVYVARDERNARDRVAAKLGSEKIIDELEIVIAPLASPAHRTL